MVRRLKGDRHSFREEAFIVSLTLSPRLTDPGVPSPERRTRGAP
jgi:hypothetical protein